MTLNKKRLWLVSATESILKKAVSYLCYFQGIFLIWDSKYFNPNNDNYNLNSKLLRLNLNLSNFSFKVPSNFFFIEYRMYLTRWIFLNFFNWQLYFSECSKILNTKFDITGYLFPDPTISLNRDSTLFYFLR